MNTLQQPRVCRCPRLKKYTKSQALIERAAASSLKPSLPLNSGESGHLNGLDWMDWLKNGLLPHVRECFHRGEKLVSLDDLQCQLSVTCNAKIKRVVKALYDFSAPLCQQWCLSPGIISLLDHVQKQASYSLKDTDIKNTNRSKSGILVLNRAPPLLSWIHQALTLELEGARAPAELLEAPLLTPTARAERFSHTKCPHNITLRNKNASVKNICTICF